MYVVFIIPRLIEKEGSREGYRDAVACNGRERDVLEYFVALYRFWLRHAAHRYVNHEIARIAGRSGRGVWKASIFFAFPWPQILSINSKRRSMASCASDRDARYTLLASILENETGIFSRLLGVACEDREGLADNLSDTTNCRRTAVDEQGGCD